MVIPFPSPLQTSIIDELERALSAAKEGRLKGIALSYIADGVMADIAESVDYHTALLLLGQSNMMRIDLIALTKTLREETPCAQPAPSQRCP